MELDALGADGRRREHAKTLALRLVNLTFGRIEGKAAGDAHAGEWKGPHDLVEVDVCDIEVGVLWAEAYSDQLRGELELESG
jgi:hypothetical protein